LVEPLFAALDVEAQAEGGPGTDAATQDSPKRRLPHALIVLAIIIAIVTVWFVTIGA